MPSTDPTMIYSGLYVKHDNKSDLQPQNMMPWKLGHSLSRSYTGRRCSF